MNPLCISNQGKETKNKAAQKKKNHRYRRRKKSRLTHDLFRNYLVPYPW